MHLLRDIINYLHSLLDTANVFQLDGMLNTQDSKQNHLLVTSKHNEFILLTVCLHIRPLHNLCLEDAVSEINLNKLHQVNAKLAVKSDVRLILSKEKHGQKTWTH